MNRIYPYHEVRYNINTLADLLIADLASLEIFTPSGTLKYKSIADVMLP